MKHDTVGCMNRVEAGDDFTFLIGSGVSAADKHHGDSRTHIFDQFARRQGALGYSFEQINKVALDA